MNDRNKIPRSGLFGAVVQFTYASGDDVVEALTSDVIVTLVYTLKPPNGTRRNKKMIPMSGCQPMKNHNNGTATQTSKIATRRRKNCLAACSIL